MVNRMSLIAHCGKAKFCQCHFVIHLASAHRGHPKKMSEYFRGEVGLKFRCCKILEFRGYANQGWNFDMVEGGIKNGQKILTSYMDGPHTHSFPKAKVQHCTVDEMHLFCCMWYIFALPKKDRQLVCLDIFISAGVPKCKFSFDLKNCKCFVKRTI